MTDDMLKASTGSRGLDEQAEGAHEARLHDGTIVTVPGEIKLARIVVGGRWFTHTGEDADGRWTYEPE